jgi:hypothetical protein
MNRLERALRLGCYTGLAAVKLGDDSYARRFIDRRIDDVSDAEFFEMCHEVHAKAVAAGIIGLDEDPFEDFAAYVGFRP